MMTLIRSQSPCDTAADAPRCHGGRRPAHRSWLLTSPLTLMLAVLAVIPVIMSRCHGQGAGAGGQLAVFGDLVHQPLGNATLAAGASGLIVSNLVAGGRDGVSVDLEELSRTATVRFAPVPLGGVVSRQFVLSMHGMVNDIPDRPLGSLRLISRVSGVTLGLTNVPPGWFSGLRIEVYNDGRLAGSAIVSADDSIALITGNARLAAATAGQANPSGSTQVLWDLEFAARVDVATGAGPALTGNRVQLTAINAVGALQNLARLAVTAGDLESFVLQEEIAPKFQPRMRIDQSGSRVRARWDTRNATLQHAPTASGPWVNLVSATNALDVAAIGTNRFFRTLTNPAEPCRTAPGAALGYVCKRNILLVILDDVGVDQLPIYTNHYNTNSSTSDDIQVIGNFLNPATLTPTIDRLAASGVTFLNAWGSPTCSPSRAGLFTGTASFRHGVYSPDAPYLATNATTIAHALGAAGYANGLFGKWHLGPDADHLPITFGWDRHEGVVGGFVTDYYNWTKDVNFMVGTNAIWFTTNTTNYATHENTDDAIAWIGSRRKPWMATVSFNAPHWANNGAGNYFQFPPPGSAYQARIGSDKGMYRSMLECVDATLTNLLTSIDSNVLEQTTIILVGDNGTEAEISDHFPNGQNKSSLYEGGVNVPLIIADGYTFLHGRQSPWIKGVGRVVAPGRFETNLVQSRDIFATAAEIARADGSCGVDSVSMVPYLTSAAATPRRTVTFAETYAGVTWNVAVRNATHKLIVKGHCGAAPTYELYDLSTDRWETTLIPEDGTSAMAVDLLAELAALLAVPAACPVTPEYPVPTPCP